MSATIRQADPAARAARGMGNVHTDYNLYVLISGEWVNVWTSTSVAQLNEQQRRFWPLCEWRVERGVWEGGDPAPPETKKES